MTNQTNSLFTFFILKMPLFDKRLMNKFISTIILSLLVVAYFQSDGQCLSHWYNKNHRLSNFL
ncbi:hypothetical protein B0182_02385 [Moraxella bovis]|nr:hypothetical protein DQF64_02700 [Moraxella bovis]OOR91806.1 hypothetical protein B0182_02385 [Moraxella bovis]